MLLPRQALRQPCHRSPLRRSLRSVTVVPINKAAILPGHISFIDGVVVLVAIEAATYALSVKEPGPCMPDVSIPAIALPYPTLQTTAPSAGKTLVVYGASSSASSKTIQITVAPGINVIAIAWPTTTTW